MNFIDCENCSDWSQLQKFEQKCEFCKSLGFIQNPDDILCNNCGCKMCPPKPDMNWQLPNGLHNVSVLGDYSSTHLTDCTQYRFSLCEFCLRMMFNSFKIPPITLNEYGDFNIGYESDKTLFEYNQWKEAGHYKQAFLNKKCNVAKDCPGEAKYTLLRSSEIYSDFCCCETHIITYGQYNWYTAVPFINDTLKAFV